MDDMAWACLDTLNRDSSQKTAFVSNLAALATEKRARRKLEKGP